MFDLVYLSGIALLKLAGMTLMAYLFYWRVIDYAHCVWFYGRQGQNVCELCPGHMPLLGNIV